MSWFSSYSFQAVKQSRAFLLLTPPLRNCLLSLCHSFLLIYSNLDIQAVKSIKQSCAFLLLTPPLSDCLLSLSLISSYPYIDIQAVKQSCAFLSFDTSTIKLPSFPLSLVFFFFFLFFLFLPRHPGRQTEPHFSSCCAPRRERSPVDMEKGESINNLRHRRHHHHYLFLPIHWSVSSPSNKKLSRSLCQRDSSVILC